MTVGFEGPTQAVQMAIYWAAWLYFPAALLLGWAIARGRGVVRWGAVLVLSGLSVLAYARFVEPRILLTAHHEFTPDRCVGSGPVRIAVFSDTHEGIFGNAIPIERIARAVNAAEPDAVLIPGDFTYYLKPERFMQTFGALGAIEAPVFAVTGNHDNGMPGPDLRQDLSNALEEIGVTVLSDSRSEIDVRGTHVDVLGMQDLWLDAADYRVTRHAPDEALSLILTHNPDMIHELPHDARFDLMVAGHTHGGQIYLPFVTCALTFACDTVREGLGRTERGPVFVTAGTGMVGLPMRFAVPPRIDILDISRSETCGSA